MLDQIVVIGLGANMENSIEALRTALNEIKKLSEVQVINVSSIYESAAQLPAGAPAEWDQLYLNSAVLCRIESSWSPSQLLYAVKQIEIKMGRLKAERWAPRPIDIDILYWQGYQIKSDELTLPHQHLAERPFALMPLLELLPRSVVAETVELPSWSQPWAEEKPFQCRPSQRYFWPRWVSVLNITSDSFSDGGSLLSAEGLLQAAEKTLMDGAEILDIGAESTRPQAAAVSNEVELKNLKWALDLLRPLRKKYSFQISLDCRHADVARPILEQHKVHFLNDVTGFNSREMQELLKQSKAFGVVMHSLSVPPQPTLTLPESENPFSYLVQWWKKRKQELVISGIAEDRMIFDPGVGFGKTKLQNFYLLSQLQNLAGQVSDPVLIGHSRKSYQLQFSSRTEAGKRDAETALVSAQLNQAYVQYLRVHDIETQKMALRFSSCARQAASMESVRLL